MSPFAPTSDKYLSIARAGHQLGIARYAVLNLVAKRELESLTIAERLVVTRASVDAYLKRNPKP